MSGPETLSPHSLNSYEWSLGFEKKDLDHVAKALHKDFRQNNVLCGDGEECVFKGGGGKTEL